jgi:hypothetical protein
MYRRWRLLSRNARALLPKRICADVEKFTPQHVSATMKLTVPSPIQNVYGILTFKLGADVLPKSQILLTVCLAAFAAAVFLFQGNFYPPARAAASGIGSAILVSAVAAVWARISGYRERLVQTLTALALGGAIVIFARVLLGLFIYLNPVFADLPDVNVRELEAFVLFPIYVWNIFVYAFLFRRSYRAEVVLAFAIAIAVVIVVYFTVPLVFKWL